MTLVMIISSVTTIVFLPLSQSSAACFARLLPSTHHFDLVPPLGNQLGMRRLKFRLVSLWRRRPVEGGRCEVSVVMTIFNKNTRVSERKQIPLKLENDGVQPFLTIPCKCVHMIEPIDKTELGPGYKPTSPLAGLTHDDMLEKDLEIYVVFRGWDTALEREVYHNWRYTLDDPSNIVFDHHFAHMHSHKDGEVSVDVGRLHRVAKDQAASRSRRLKHTMDIVKKINSHKGKRVNSIELVKRMLSTERSVE